MRQHTISNKFNKSKKLNLKSKVKGNIKTACIEISVFIS